MADGEGEVGRDGQPISGLNRERLHRCQRILSQLRPVVEQEGDVLAVAII